MPYGRIGKAVMGAMRRGRHFKKGFKTPYGALRGRDFTVFASAKAGSKAYRAGVRKRRLYEGVRRGLGGRKRFNTTVPGLAGGFGGTYKRGIRTGRKIRRRAPYVAGGSAALGLSVWARKRRKK